MAATALTGLTACGDEATTEAPLAIPATLPRVAGCAPFETDAAGDEVWVASLRDTGCYALEAAVEYDVRVPLWSDTAAKARYLVLPLEGTIGYSDTRPWDLPAGTVVLKDFILDGEKIETRVLARRGSHWVGASYRWSGDDATLVADGADVEIGGISWRFPSTEDCDQCHTRASGGLLGVTSEQLDRTADMFGQGDVDQIAGLDALGAFGDTFDGHVAAAPLAPIDDARASREYRVRSYLAANCAGCHQPGGAAHSDLDLRMATSLADSGLCRTAAENYGLENGARVVEPGSPERSVLPHLMALTGEGQMPPLARTLLDDAAIALVEEWIAGLDACP